MKVCTRCSQSKSLEDFAKQSRRKDGRSSWCKSCFAEHAKTKFQSDPAERARKRRNRKGFAKANHAKALEYLKEHPCVDCGETDVRVLEFDHRDAEAKVFDIGNRYWTHSWANLLVEIEKCDVRCANCHRKVTWERAGSWRALIGM